MLWFNFLLHREPNGRKSNVNTRDSREVCWHRLGFLIALLICLVCVTGESRSRGVLAFLFSTAKERGFSATDYQKFATGIRKAFPPSVVETVG
jgi:hypothetical protein